MKASVNQSHDEWWRLGFLGPSGDDQSRWNIVSWI